MSTFALPGVLDDFASQTVEPFDVFDKSYKHIGKLDSFDRATWTESCNDFGTGSLVFSPRMYPSWLTIGCFLTHPRMAFSWENGYAAGPVKYVESIEHTAEKITVNLVDIRKLLTYRIVLPGQTPFDLANRSIASWWYELFSRCVGQKAGGRSYGWNVFERFPASYSNVTPKGFDLTGQNLWDAYHTNKYRRTEYAQSYLNNVQPDQYFLYNDYIEVIGYRKSDGTLYPMLRFWMYGNNTEIVEVTPGVGIVKDRVNDLYSIANDTARDEVYAEDRTNSVNAVLASSPEKNGARLYEWVVPRNERGFDRREAYLDVTDVDRSKLSDSIVRGQLRHRAQAHIRQNSKTQFLNFEWEPNAEGSLRFRPGYVHDYMTRHDGIIRAFLIEEITYTIENDSVDVFYNCVDFSTIRREL